MIRMSSDHRLLKIISLAENIFIKIEKTINLNIVQKQIQMSAFKEITKDSKVVKNKKKLKVDNLYKNSFFKQIKHIL